MANDDLLAVLAQFHQEVVRPDMERMMARELERFHQEVVRPDMLEMLGHFHREVVRPDMEQMMARELTRFHEEVVRPDVQGMFANFHRDVVAPEFESVRAETASLRAEMRLLRDNMNSGFDHVYKRLETMEIDFQLMREQLAQLTERCDRIESGLGSIENEMQRLATHAEVESIRDEIAKLLKRVDDLERPA